MPIFVHLGLTAVFLLSSFYLYERWLSRKIQDQSRLHASERSNELNRRIKDGSRATTLSLLSSIGTLAGITLNPLIGHVGDLGLSTTGVSLGLRLILLGLVVGVLI